MDIENEGTDDGMISKKYFGEDKNIEFKREIPNNHEKLEGIWISLVFK